MSKGLNSATVFGGLVRDPDVKYGQNGGTAFIGFTLAVGFSVKDKQTGEWEQRADYVPCKAFGRTAEVIGKYCRKGSRLLVTGRIKTESYEKNGQKVYSTCIYVDDLILGDRPEKKDGESGGQYQQSRHEQQKANGYAPQDKGGDWSLASGPGFGGEDDFPRDFEHGETADIPF